MCHVCNSKGPFLLRAHSCLAYDADGKSHSPLLQECLWSWRNDERRSLISGTFPFLQIFETANTRTKRNRTKEAHASAQQGKRHMQTFMARTTNKQDTVKQKEVRAVQIGMNRLMHACAHTNCASGTQHKFRTAEPKSYKECGYARHQSPSVISSAEATFSWIAGILLLKRESPLAFHQR